MSPSNAIFYEQEYYPLIVASKSKTPVRRKANTPLSKTSDTPSVATSLRTFAQQVAAKVKERCTTTFQEVADEMVTEMSRISAIATKNLRRRVYDALNVLLAIDVIRREDKRTIRWVGAPEQLSSPAQRISQECAVIGHRINDKRQEMLELLSRVVCLRSLISRNSALEEGSSVAFRRGSRSNQAETDRLQLPFVLISAPKECRVHCEMLEDR